MITNIKLKNIGSIGEAELDLNKGKFQFHNEKVLNDTVVNPAAIYGHNGSGKSSIISAFASLVSMLTSLPDNILPPAPNFMNIDKLKEILNKKINDSLETKKIDKLLSSAIVLEFTLKDKDKYRYEITTQLDNVIFEKLTCNSKKIIVRSGKECVTYFSNQEEEHMFEAQNEKLLALRIFYGDNCNEQVKDAYEFLSDIVVWNSDEHKCMKKDVRNTNFRDLMVEKSEEVNKILAKYKEFPTYRIYKESSIDSLSNPLDANKSYFIELDCENGDKIKLPMPLMSNGMKCQSMLLSLLLTMKENRVLVVDELDEGLHISALKSFIDEVLNKKIQLIFTSHNTSLMNNYLRPDQIYLTKWINGYSSCRRLSDLNTSIREVNNIEKMYIKNSFDY